MQALLSPKQVARAIGVSEASLKRWCDKGLLRAIRTAGGHRRISTDGVMQFLRESGRPLVRPEVLDLPATIGTGSTATERAAEHLQDALERGDEDAFRATLINLYLARHSVCDICDKVVAPGFAALGSKWQHGDLEVYQERRGCEICFRSLVELRSFLPPASDDAPYAIGGALEHDPYTLPTIMVELTLRELGWRAESLGVGHPTHTLCAAIRDKRPRLVWVSFSTLEPAPDFPERWQEVYQTALACDAAVAVGGRALAEEVRREISYSAYCDGLRHLVAFANSMFRARRQAPSE